jgi:phosphoribulokinase
MYSFLSNTNFGGKMGFAMELILTPIIHRMVEDKKLA